MQASGNRFQTIPDLVLECNNLKKLDLSSIGLEIFDEEKIRQALPNLAKLKLNYNNLTAPIQMKNWSRPMEVSAYGNPYYLKLQDLETLKERMQIGGIHYLFKVLQNPFFIVSSASLVILGLTIFIYIYLIPHFGLDPLW